MRTRWIMVGLLVAAAVVARPSGIRACDTGGPFLVDYDQNVDPNAFHAKGNLTPTFPTGTWLFKPVGSSTSKQFITLTVPPHRTLLAVVDDISAAETKRIATSDYTCDSELLACVHVLAAFDMTPSHEYRVILGGGDTTATSYEFILQTDDLIGIP